MLVSKLTGFFCVFPRVARFTSCIMYFSQEIHASMFAGDMSYGKPRGRKFPITRLVWARKDLRRWLRQVMRYNRDRLSSPKWPTMCRVDRGYTRTRPLAVIIAIAKVAAVCGYYFDFRLSFLVIFGFSEVAGWHFVVVLAWLCFGRLLKTYLFARY